MQTIFDTFKEVRKKIDEADYVGFRTYPPMSAWDLIDTEDVLKGWKNSLNEKHDHLGLYVHIPFCATRCTFCRCYAIALSEENNIDGYLSALKNEIRIYSKIFNNIPFKTLYIGGGTPSLLNIKQLKFLFEALYENFNFEHKKQVAFEGVSDFLNPEKLAYLKEMGMDRLTLGVQTLNKKILKEVNRYQNNDKFFSCYENARKAGIKYINVDIMLGLPGQTLESVWETLRDIVVLKPDIIHCNPFIPSQFTVLQDQDTDKINQMIKLAKTVLRRHGYKGTHYDAEALSPEAINIQLSDVIEYNSSYLGIGVSSDSHATGHVRTVNTDNFNLYISQLDKNELAVSKGYKVSPKDEMIYYVISALRYGRVTQKGFGELFERNLIEVFAKEIGILKNAQKVEEENGDLISLMSGIDEYAVYSKIFFDQKIINRFVPEKSEN